MKKKLILTLTCTFALVTMPTACGKSSSGNAANGGSSAANGFGDTIAVKYSVTYPATGTQADGANALAELIEECSDGRLKMEFYPSSQLGDKASTFEGLRAGTIEMTECALTDLSTFNSMWSVFSLPYLWDSGKQAIQTIMDPAVTEALEADMEANGFKVIAWTDLGSRSIVNTKRAINTPADLHGLKIRCMEDAVLAAATTAMGAIATPLAFSEVYTGMQQGTLDGADYQIPNVYASAWQEICPYMSLTEHFTIPDVVFVSKAWFDRLSAEDQQALLDAGEAFTEQWNNEIWPNATDSARAGLEEAGMTINEVDKEPFIQAVRPVIDGFLASATEEQKNLYDLLMETREKY